MSDNPWTTCSCGHIAQDHNRKPQGGSEAGPISGKPWGHWTAEDCDSVKTWGCDRCKCAKYDGKRRHLTVTRKSPLTGRINTLAIPGLTQEMLDEIDSRNHTPRNQWRHMQDVMQGVTPALREFVATGYTPQDWTAMFPPEDGDDEPEEGVRP